MFSLSPLMLSLSDYVLSREGWMGGLSLALAPACLTLAVWVTRSHLRQPPVASPRPSPVAWLLSQSEAQLNAQGVRLYAPALWFARVSLIALLCALPSVYQPWLNLSAQPSPRGTLVLTTGPLKINPNWERPLWVITPAVDTAPLQWLNDQGEGSAEPTELSPTITYLSAPRSSLKWEESEADAERERLLSAASAALIRRGRAARSFLAVQAASPTLLAARLSWRSRTEGVPLTLHLEAQIQGDGTPLTLSLEALRGGSWVRFKTLAQRQDQREIWEAWLERDVTGAVWRLCAYEPERASECLHLQRPPRTLKLAHAGWPEGVTLLLSALPEVEWGEADEADWVASSGALDELNKTLAQPPQGEQLKRWLLFIGGQQLEAPALDEDLSLGALEQLHRWTPLPPLTPTRLSALLPWASHLKAETLLYAPLSTEDPGARLAPVLNELSASEARRSLTINLIGWSPKVSDELTALAPLLTEWLELHRSSLVIAGQREALSVMSRRLQHHALAARSARPQQAQVERRVTFSGSSAPAEVRPWPRQALLVALSLVAGLTLLLSARPLSAIMFVLCSLWALSASEPGSSFRGLGGLWRAPPTIHPSLAEGSPSARREAQRLWRRWRPKLLKQGARLRGPRSTEGLELHIGEAPPIRSGLPDLPLWVLPTQVNAQPPELSKVSSAWSSDQTNLWVSASLTGSPALSSAHTDLARSYELWLLSEDEPRLIGRCRAQECDGLRAAVLVRPTQTPTRVALYERLHSSPLNSRSPDGALIEERELITLSPPSPQEAWAWGQQNASWLSAAGYRRYTPPRDALTAPPPERVKLIALHDTPATSLTEQKVEELKRWVSTGGTLLLSGRTKSFDQGGWLGSSLERLSPLISRPEVRQQARVVFLIDVSGSVSREAGGLGVSALIEESLRLAAQLDSRDEVALIAFSGAAELIIPPTTLSELSAVLAPTEGSGGSSVSAGLHEALQWLADSGPQRWVILTDGELNSAGLSSTLQRINERRSSRDLSLLIALTSERALSPQAERVLQTLKHSVDAQVSPLSQLSPSNFLSWRDGRAHEPHEAPQRQAPQRVWGTASAQGRLGVNLPPVWGGAGVQLKQGATLLAERDEPLGRLPLLAEWRYGLGRVIALATDEWTLAPSAWRALLSPARSVKRRGWRFLWVREAAALVASGPASGALRGRGVLIGPQGEVVSGRWRPLLGGGALLRAQDGGALDERAKAFEALELRTASAGGLLKVVINSEDQPVTVERSLRPLTRRGGARVLSEREAFNPSPALIDELIEASSSPRPLPSTPMVLLLLGLGFIELRGWRLELT